MTPRIDFINANNRIKQNLEIQKIPTYEQMWTLESIIGTIYSTSYGAIRFLRDNLKSFEN